MSLSLILGPSSSSSIASTIINIKSFSIRPCFQPAKFSYEDVYGVGPSHGDADPCRDDVELSSPIPYRA